MKKGISWFTLPGQLSSKEKLELVKDAGFEGIEIIPFRGNEDEAFKIKEIADKMDLTITSIIDIDQWKYQFSNPDVDVREIAFNNFVHDLKLASQLNVDTVLCIPAVVNKTVTYEEAYARSLDGIKRLVEFAEKYIIVIAIENVWNKFLLSPIEFVNYIDSFNSIYVKAYFDCGNICLYGFPQHWIKSLGPNRLAKIHVKGFDDYPKNIGFPKSLISDVPWTEFMNSLKEINYSDFLIVEIKGEGKDSIEKVYQYSKELDIIINNSL
jgi:hexulose-6-phosphate isomerase